MHAMQAGLASPFGLEPCTMAWTISIPMKNLPPLEGKMSQGKTMQESGAG